MVYRTLAFLGCAAMVFAIGCGASAVGGPDPARSTFFRATLVDGGALPAEVHLPGLLAPLYLKEARLVPIDLGRTTDTRIFDDRGGTGSGSGNGRDSTVSTGKMSDVRIFANGAGATSYDSVSVDVIRVGDILYITRPHPSEARNVTDTAHYESGVLVRKVRYWRVIEELPTGQVITYTTVK